MANLAHRLAALADGPDGRPLPAAIAGPLTAVEALLALHQLADMLAPGADRWAQAKAVRDAIRWFESRRQSAIARGLREPRGTLEPLLVQVLRHPRSPRTLERIYKALRPESDAHGQR